MEASTHASHAALIVSRIPLGEEPGLGSLTLGGYLREVTTRFSEREALVMRTAEGVERWSYATVWERSVEVARALLACGLGKDGRVGVLMTNRLEWLSSVFGVALAGGVAVTLSTFSTPAELEYLLQVSSISVLLFERQVLKTDFATILTDLEPEIGNAAPDELISVKFPYLRRLAMVEGSAEGGAIEAWGEFLARGASVSPELVEATAAAVKPSDPGVIFFSSGSTSKPKGILSAHRGVAIQLWRWRRMFGLEGDVRCWTANGFFWSGNFGMAIGGTFSCGGAVVLQSTFAAAEAVDLMQVEKVNFPLAWPHQWAKLAEAPNFSAADLSSMRYADAATPIGKHPTVASRWVGPNATYGNTETFTISTAYPAETPPEVVGGSYGEALPGNTIKIVDPLSGATLAIGERGEIAVKGPTLMLGYLGVPADETLDSEGFFRTGDGGYVDETGRLFWEGRLNDIVKTGGANVSPLEIDGELTTYPGIRVVQTVGVPHETLGEMVVSCVVPHEGIELNEPAIRDFLKERLASYKVPRRILFFREDELSLTGSAKVKSNALRELAAKRLKAEALA